jgi:cysteine-rich repeat protein
MEDERMNSMIRNRRTRHVATLLSAACLLASAALAHADATKASRACRGSIGLKLPGLIGNGLARADACHRKANKFKKTAVCNPGAAGPCNDVSTPAFDPKGAYANAKLAAEKGLDKKCLAGDPVLNNYDGGDVDGATFPVIDGAVEGNSVLALGSAAFPCDKAKAKCISGIARNRSKVVRAIVAASVKCQKALDKKGTTFGPFKDPDCVDMGQKASDAATTDIPKSCGSLTGADVGSCSPLPSCVIQAAQTAGKGLAKAIYQTKTPATCGDGTLDAGEQCDHGVSNGTPGDTCSATCESLLDTCTPVVGHRITQVDINLPPGAPELAGVQITIDYPQPLVSVPGHGDTNTVKSRVTVQQSGGLLSVNDDDKDFTLALASATGFITGGHLFTVDFDECALMSQNICSRDQAVYGCCSNPADPNQFGNFCTKKACASDNTIACTTDANCPGGVGDCSVKLPCTFVPGDECIGTGTDATPQFGACVFKCPSNPPDCPQGHFPIAHCLSNPAQQCSSDAECTGGYGDCVSVAGTCDNVVGACPSNNVCQQQADAFAACGISDPVDANGQPVAGVTCSLTFTETP